jgi:hypothetical protein
MDDIDILDEKVENVRKIIPPPIGFSNMMDTSIPKLLPKLLYYPLKANIRTLRDSSKSSIYDVLKKLDLC